ncbi:2'-5' RNA ligase family protein [Saccharopolyspora taberi]|uniref:2'-5' RNA ligase family protein n=1 Tax=Saccharopolyspora taberi TaxID=60895 RepID=UPI0031E0871E
MRTLVNEYQRALQDLPGFDLVPLEWMHILVQEAGFTDEIDESLVGPMVEAVRARIAGTGPLSLAFHRAVVLPESLSLPAEPQSSLHELRDSVRSALGEVLGAVPAEPEESDRHVNLAHSTSEGPAIFAVATLGATVVEPTTVRVPSLSLVRLSRDHSTSEWEVVTEVPFGG